MLKDVFHRIYTYRGFLVVASVLVAFVLADVLTTYLSLGVKFASGEGISFFSLIVVVFAVTQYLILGCMNRISQEIRSRLDIVNNITRIIRPIQFVLIGFLISLILQIIIISTYYTAILIWSTTISYALSVILIGTLAFQFFSWYRSNRNFVVLLYGIASIAIAIRITSVLFFYSSLLLNMPPERFLQSEIILEEFEPNSVIGMFHNAYSISSIVSFMLLWIGNAFLLRHYYNKIGKIKFLSLVTLIPIFTSIDFVLTGTIVEEMGVNPVASAIFFTAEGAVAGFFLALTFWVLAGNVAHSSIRVRNYLTITGFGILIFTLSGSSLIDHAPYPPFGLVSILSMQLATFLIYMGLYSSAVSVSQDTRLRQYIRKQTFDQSKLIESIGSAEMESEIIKKVKTLEKKEEENMLEDTGIPFSLSDDEVSDYIDSVMQELKGHRK
jgi:hypothetical protein